MVQRSSAFANSGRNGVWEARCTPAGLVRDRSQKLPHVGVKYQITAIIIEACGGPYKYHGRDMYETHKNLHITQEEWDAGVMVLKGTLDRFKVPAAEEAELNALIAKTHDQIVTPGRIR
jgi:hypothetical protein